MKEKAEGSLIILNRSVVIGIIVLVTTVSFTFGYFVGRYSSKVRSNEPEVRGEISEKSEREMIPSGESAESSGTVSPHKEATSGSGTPSMKLEPAEKAPESLREKPSSPVERGSSPEKVQEQKTSQEQKPMAKAEEEATLKKGAYYLQVGAFKEEERAKKFSEHFKKEHYDVIIKKEGSFYRVYLGTFKTKKEALLSQTRLRKLYKIESVVTKK